MDGENFLYSFAELPLPPSENQLYRNVPRVGRVKTQAYKDYQGEFEAWAWKYYRQLKEAQRIVEPHPMLSLIIDFQFFYPRLFCKDGSVKKMDVTNRLKCFLDLLSNHLHIDDSRFFQVSCQKSVGLTEGAFVFIDRMSFV